MEFDRVALKRQARRDMQKKRPSVLLVSFVYLVLTTGVSFAVSQVAFGPLRKLLSAAAAGEMTGEEVMLLLREQGIDLLSALSVGVGLTILVGIFTSILQFGYTVYTLNLAKGQKAGFGSLLSGFGMLGRVLGLSIVIGVFTLLWTLAFVGAAMGLGALCAWLFANVLNMEWAGLAMMYLLLAAAYVLLFARILRYAMAFRVLADDPEAGIMGAIERSKELMKGRRWELVKLELSFLGWMLAECMVVLAVIYVGLIAVIFVAEVAYISGTVTETQMVDQIQMLAENSWVLLAAAELGTILFNMWLAPYIAITESHFYLAVSGRQVPEPLPVGTWTRQPPVPPAPPVPPTPPTSPIVPLERPFTPLTEERHLPAQWPEEPPAPGFAEAEEVPGPSEAKEDAPAEAGQDFPPAEQPEEEPFAPKEAEKKRGEDPWDRPADSRRNPDDPF